ncbi:hypothetical protein B0H11DRAFT_2366685 [Mycena galericulata]|nr:hypothetical protein B0H11DRAFT_2366685 [Mycena galericulata]
MVQIVWDNLNIAFKVAAQRPNSKSHFDNGTTSTAIPVFDPATGGQAAHGTLPLEMKPPRERTLPVLDWSPEDVLPSPESAAQFSSSCFWELKRMALEHVPGVSEELRNSLGDCPEVYQIPLHKTPQYPLPAMKEDESTLEGTLEVYFRNLDVMGMGDKELEAHGLMFDDGDLLTDALKEKIESARRNSTTPIAGMRGSVRRWGLFHGQMAGGRLTINEHWGQPNSLWPGGLWWEHNKLLKRKPLMAGWGGKKATDWKPAHELIHISLPAHIVDGETNFSKGIPVDLLQEHQNLWAKIIYNAKGSNKSWKWLSMITVCIFTLRDAMRTVQTAFQIPAYGERHRNPPITDEVALIAKALQDEGIQTYIEHRPANDHVSPVRDLIKEGAMYANSRKAFHRFTRDTRRPERRGFDTAEGGEEDDLEDEDDGEGEEENYEPSLEDLRVDDEEFLMEPDAMMAAAMELVDSSLGDLE